MTGSCQFPVYHLAVFPPPNLFSAFTLWRTQDPSFNTIQTLQNAHPGSPSIYFKYLVLLREFHYLKVSLPTTVFPVPNNSCRIYTSLIVHFELGVKKIFCAQSNQEQILPKKLKCLPQSVVLATCSFFYL